MIAYQKFNSSVPFNYDLRHYKNFNYIPHIHRDYEFVLVTSGELEVTVAQTTFTCREGEAALIMQNEVHNYSSPTESQATVAVFSEDYVREFTANMKKRSVSSHKLILSDTDKKFLSENMLTDAPSCLVLIAALSLITARFYSLCTEPRKSKDARTDEIARSVLEYIEEHYTEHLTLSELASSLGYEEHYLSRVINNFFGKSLTSLINEYRVYHARRLLAEGTDTNLTQIAFECGFGSLRNFNRAYRAVVGKSPREK